MKNSFSGIGIMFGFLFAFSACQRAFVIYPYPVDRTDTKQSQTESTKSEAVTACSNNGCTDKSAQRYYSAFFYVDPPLLARIWKIRAWADYALITAKVVLPGENASSNAFPLFTVNKGVIQSSLGRDLLAKYPILEDGRGQISITLDVIYLKDLVALQKVQAIISIANSAASSYLSNYPVAAQLMDTANKIINQVAEKATTGDATIPNSLTSNLSFTFDISHENEMKQCPKGHTCFLKAYLFTDGEEDSFSETPKTTEANKIKQSGIKEEKKDKKERFKTNRKPVYPCQDLPSALCREPDARYSEEHFTDAAYITILFDAQQSVYDPQALIGGTPNLGACNLITSDEIGRVEKYMAMNQSLFTSENVSLSHETIAVARSYVQAKDYFEKGRFSDLLDLIMARSMELFDNQKSNKPSMKNNKDAFLTQFIYVSACWNGYWSQPPLKDMQVAVQNYRSTTLCSRLPENRRPKCKLDAIGDMLTPLLDPSDSYQATSKDSNVRYPFTSHTARALHREGNNLAIKTKDIIAKQKFNCGDTGFADVVSRYCGDLCESEILKKCPQKAPGIIREVNSAPSMRDIDASTDSTEVGPSAPAHDDHSPTESTPKDH